jgi:hypothetical protein
VANRLRKFLSVGGALGLVAAPAAGVLLGLPQATGAAAPIAYPAFNATAAASALRLTLEDPGAPLSDQLVDTGGPTAQSAMASLGTTTAYAALPDPGSLVNSAPGLVIGLVGQGAYGLPPIKLPSLPPLPLQVSTDANGKQSATFGAGPYKLTASSTDDHSTASATGGLSTTGASVLGLTANASITKNSDGSVTATATSNAAGLALGPIKLGTIVSTATERITQDGKITSSADTKIVGLSLAGIGVSINEGGVSVDGLGISIPLAPFITPLLKGSGDTLTFQDVTSTAGTVFAPNVVLTIPFKGSTGPGYLRLVIGGSTVSMTGVGAAPATVPIVTPPSNTGGGSGSVGGLLPGDGDVPPIVGSSPPSVSGTQPIVSPPSTAPSPVATAERLPPIGLFSIRSLYLVVAGLALAMFLLGQLIRLLGVRA